MFGYMLVLYVFVVVIVGQSAGIILAESNLGNDRGFKIPEASNSDLQSNVTGTNQFGLFKLS
jgi:hypothetical protein